MPSPTGLMDMFNALKILSLLLNRHYIIKSVKAVIARSQSYLRRDLSVTRSALMSAEAEEVNKLGTSLLAVGRRLLGAKREECGGSFTPTPHFLQPSWVPTRGSEKQVLSHLLLS